MASSEEELENIIKNTLKSWNMISNEDLVPSGAFNIKQEPAGTAVSGHCHQGDMSGGDANPTTQAKLEPTQSRVFRNGWQVFINTQTPYSRNLAPAVDGRPSELETRFAEMQLRRSRSVPVPAPLTTPPPAAPINVPADPDFSASAIENPTAPTKKGQANKLGKRARARALNNSISASALYSKSKRAKNKRTCQNQPAQAQSGATKPPMVAVILAPYILPQTSNIAPYPAFGVANSASDWSVEPRLTLTAESLRARQRLELEVELERRRLGLGPNHH